VLYQRPAIRRRTAAGSWAPRSPRQTGITVQLKNDAEDVLTAQLQQEGSRLPRRTSSFSEELQLAAAARRPRACWAGRRRAPPLARVPGRGTNAAKRPSGWASRAGNRRPQSTTPARSRRPQVAHLGHGSGRPEVQGQARAGRRPRPTSGRSSRSIMRARYGPRRARRSTWLEGLKSNARAPTTTRPTTRRWMGDVSKGDDAEMGLINHYYYFRIRSEMGQGQLPRQGSRGSPPAIPASSRTSRPSKGC